ncbi:MAG: hypothetical protein ACYDAO_04305 [Thermoplasmataceae archaeon]
MEIIAIKEDKAKQLLDEFVWHIQKTEDRFHEDMMAVSSGDEDRWNIQSCRDNKINALKKNFLSVLFCHPNSP